MALSAGPSRPQEPLSRHAKPGPRGSPTRRARRHGGAGEARASQNELRRRTGRGPCNRFSHANFENCVRVRCRISRAGGPGSGEPGPSPLVVGPAYGTTPGPHRHAILRRLQRWRPYGRAESACLLAPLHAHRVVVWIPRRLRGALPLDVGTNSVSGARTPITRYGSHNGGTRMRPNERGPRDAANARGRGSGGVAPPRRHRDRHLRALRRSVVTNCS